MTAPPTRGQVAQPAQSIDPTESNKVGRIDTTPLLSLSRSRRTFSEGGRIPKSDGRSQLFQVPYPLARDMICRFSMARRMLFLLRVTDNKDKWWNMTTLTIKLPTDPIATPCKLCGRGTPATSGPNLYLSDDRELVCQECGRKHAPALAALLELAHVAQRVGRINRHTLVPAFHELLELARAAENYSDTSVQVLSRAS